MVKRLLILIVLIIPLFAIQCNHSTVTFTLELVTGGNQVGDMGQVLARPVVIRVLDSQGTPKPGAVVTVTVTQGDGNLNQSGFSADASGQVTIWWELGSDYKNTLRVTLQVAEDYPHLPPTLTVTAVSLYVYRVPEEIPDGWETGAIDSNTVDLETIEGVLDNIRSGAYEKIHSVLMVKSGKLIFEEYFPGVDSNGNSIDYDRDTKHEVQSASKSVRSALIGIAIDHGFIESEDVDLFSFYPEYAYLNTGLKTNIKLDHVLTMSTGFEWHENDYPFTDSRNTLTQLYNLPNTQWSRFVLEQPIAEEPGTTWLYNTGASLMLNDILSKVTGMRADHFADQYLYNKMESANVADHWPPLASGLLPRDMAKLGWVFLNKGYWKDTRIVSESWIEKSTQKRFQVGNKTGYGFQWWMFPFTVNGEVVESFYASGNGGQYIFVFPSIDMVIVFTGGNFFSSTAGQVFGMLEEQILPAFNPTIN
ncbi:MAG: serine hydrolase [bacterium]|nr:serine hydrolase [bacterium]